MSRWRAVPAGGAPVRGVYAIFLVGTPYVYVGEAANVAGRWRAHRDLWVWPNPAEYVLVREMPDASVRERHRTESALARLLRSKGYTLVSRTAEEHGRERALRTKGTISSARRSAITRAVRAQWTAEKRREVGAKISRAVKPGQRAQAKRDWWAKLAPAERVELERKRAKTRKARAA